MQQYVYRYSDKICADKIAAPTDVWAYMEEVLIAWDLLLQGILYIKGVPRRVWCYNAHLRIERWVFGELWKLHRSKQTIVIIHWPNKEPVSVVVFSTIVSLLVLQTSQIWVVQSSPVYVWPPNQKLMTWQIPRRNAFSSCEDLLPLPQ